jgi:SSS family solute:Na+ symporter
VAIYWKRATREGAIAGVVTGAIVSLIWLVLRFKKSAETLGINKALMDQSTIINTIPWPTVDPMIIALSVAVIATIVLSYLTKPPEKEFLDKCFEDVDEVQRKIITYENCKLPL